MERISRGEYLMEAAKLAARRSTCNRLQVGAILERAGRVVVSGYNGAPSLFPHCSPQSCNPAEPCNRTVHAEANCIYFAARNGISTEGTWLWTTDSPCKTCAEAIVNAGISGVIYLREYRDIRSLELLRRGGVAVERFVEGPSYHVDLQ